MSAINGLLERFVRRGRVVPMPSADRVPPTASVEAHAAEPVTTELGVVAERPATLRERGRMRKRLAYLRQLRELQLRDIGGFMLEQHRRGRLRPDLLQSKVQGAAATDREARALEHALDVDAPLAELRVPGIGGACGGCGRVHGSEDRYCSWCGQRL